MNVLLIKLYLVPAADYLVVTICYLIKGSIGYAYRSLAYLFPATNVYLVSGLRSIRYAYGISYFNFLAYSQFSYLLFILCQLIACIFLHNAALALIYFQPLDARL
jgi:hypothetical protein